MVLGIIGGVVLVALLGGLYIWTRRSERDIEIPRRELSEREQDAGRLERGIVTNIFSGGI